jgi:hypothetical protein
MKKKQRPLFADESFEFKGRARVAATIDKETGRLTLWLKFEVRHPDGEHIKSPSGHLAGAVENCTHIPLECFNSDEQIKEFVQAVRDRFADYGALLLAHQGTLHLGEVAELQTNYLKPNCWGNVDEKLLITEHLQETEYILKLIYGVQDAPKKNGRGKWTKDDLHHELRKIAKEIPRKARPTFQMAADELNKQHPDRALKNGEVLRKLCDRLGVKATRFRNRGGNRNEKLIPLGSPNRN